VEESRLEHSLRKLCLDLLLILPYCRAELLYFLVVALGFLEKVADGKHLPSQSLAGSVGRRCSRNAYWLSVFAVSSSDSALFTGD
jgi:hypothetical protein